MANDIIAIGGGCIDHLSIVSHSDDGWEQCGVPLVQGGGPAATAATAIARLGGAVELWCPVGDDHHGRMVRAELARDGVDTSQVLSVPGYRTPSSFIEVDSKTGERVIFGSGFDAKPEGFEERLDPSRARSAKVLLLTRLVPDTAIRAAKEVHAAGGIVVADLFGVTGPVSEMVHHVDALILPEFAIETLAGKHDIRHALEVLADLGSKMPAITVGPRGSYYLNDGTLYHLPAFKVATVDTTGCGDSFHGAFCFAASRGHDQHESMRFAAAVAALKATKLGGRSGLPTLPAVLEFLESRTGEAWPSVVKDL